MLDSASPELVSQVIKCKAEHAAKSRSAEKGSLTIGSLNTEKGKAKS